MTDTTTATLIDWRADCEEQKVENARLRAENARLRDLVPTAYSGGFNDSLFNRRQLVSDNAWHDECWERSPVRALLADIVGSDG